MITSSSNDIINYYATAAKNKDNGFSRVILNLNSNDKMESIFNKSFTNPTEKPTRWSLFSIKIQALMPAASLKRYPSTGVFPVEFAKLPRTPFFCFLQNIPGGCLSNQTVISTEAVAPRYSIKKILFS